MTTCYCVAFSPDAGILVGGSAKALHLFDAGRPGRPLAVLPLAPTRRSRDGQRGPASALAFRQDDSRLLAVGSFAGTVGLYDLRMPEDAARVLLLAGPHREGVTQVAFAPDGWALVSAARKEETLISWDLRSGSPAYGYGPRPSRTNQRLYFAIDASRSVLLSGDQDGNLLQFPLRSVGEEGRLAEDAAHPQAPIATAKAANDTVSSVSVTAHHPDLIAITAGQRHFGPLPADSDDDDRQEEGAERNSQHGTSLDSSTLAILDRRAVFHVEGWQS